MSSDKQGLTHRQKIILGLMVLLLLAGIGLFLYQRAMTGTLSSLLTARTFGLDYMDIRQDSWNPMREAYVWFLAHPKELLYQQVFFQQHIKFQYPPSSLLMFSLADVLHFNLTNVFLNYVSWVFLGLECAAVGILAYELAGRRGWVTSNKLIWRFGAVVIAILCLSFYPMHKSYSLGQVQTWMNTWFLIACICWLHHKRLLAGLLIGGICIFKPQFGLFILWAALRGEKRFLAGWAAIVAPIEAISLAVFGCANHLDYLATLRFLARHGEVFYANQSINGLLNRALSNGNALTFEATSFPPDNTAVYLGTLLTSLILIGGAMIYRMRKRPANIVDFAIAGLTFTVASPIAWEHHYGMMPAMLVLAALTIAAMPASRAKIAFIAAFVVCTILAAMYIPAAKLVPLGAGQIFQSYLLFGALGILTLLYLLRDRYTRYFEQKPVLPAA